MSRFLVGDTVAFQHAIAEASQSPALLAFRAVVTAVAGQWVFMQEPGGRERVMPAESMRRVGRGGRDFALLSR